MGLFKTEVEVGLLKEGNLIFQEKIELIVDTGATYTTLPARLLQNLGTKPVGTIPIILADGRVVLKPYGGAWLNISGRAICATVLFGEENDLPLLGATSLEQAGFGVDPIKKCLIPIQAIQA